MSQMLTLCFDFEEGFHYSFIYVKEHKDQTEYKIRLLDEGLQNLIAKNNIIKEIDGQLNIQIPKTDKIKELILKIAEALSILVKRPILMVF